MTMNANAATRMVAKAERRERAKATAALAKWLPMRRAHLALVPLTSENATTDADVVEALLAGWAKATALEATEAAEDSAS